MFPRVPLPAMNDPRPADLEARMSRLEAVVDELRQAVRRMEAAAAPGSAFELPAAARVDPPRPGAAAPGSVPLAAAEAMPAGAAAVSAAPAEPDGETGGPLAWLPAVQPVLNGEFWLSKVGIGLLLLGVAFLFKYSIEQGYLHGMQMYQQRKARRREGGCCQGGYGTRGDRYSHRFFLKNLFLFPQAWDCTKVVAPQERRPRWGTGRSWGLATKPEEGRGITRAPYHSLIPPPLSLAAGKIAR